MDVQVEYLAELSPLLEPIDATAPSGEDPRYDESFLKIKTEIEKSSYVDYYLIKQLAIEILTYKSKDLRVAGYLMIACGQENGVMGLATAIHVYAHLIQTFWDSLHPRRAVARQAAFDWLKSPKLAQMVRELSRCNKEEQEALKRAITHLNLALSKHVGQNSKELSFLEEWLSYSQTEEPKISKFGQWMKRTVATEPLAEPPPWATQAYLKSNEATHKKEYHSEKVSPLISSLLTVEARPPERERFLQAYRIVEQCLKEKRFDVAQPILENLEALIAYHQLHTWEPQLALDVWTMQLKLYSEYQKQISAKTIQELRRKIAEVSISALV